jgi:cytochrome c biogenesis protein CcmG/thiol:disulfide interchange protein DsbE
MDNPVDLDLELNETEAVPVARHIHPVFVLVPLAVVILLAAIFGIQLVRRGQTQPTEGAAPPFSLTTFDGETYTLEKLRGKIAVVNFWASWCGPCRAEAPELQKAWEKYRDKGVVLLGVAYTDTERQARAFIAEFKQTYPNGLDIGTKISTDYRIRGVPETFFIDRNGKIVRFFMEPLNLSMISSVLDKMLAEG